MLAPDDDLGRAMALIDQAGESHIAVIDLESRRVLGVIHAHEVVLAYCRALLQARADERGETLPGRRRR